MRDVEGLDLGASIARAASALQAMQRDDGHWIFELEADATIPSEYVLLTHYLGEEPDLALERKIAAYLRRVRRADGGWPLVHGGPFNMSASVKAYFALKVIGDPPDAPHMRAAREAIVAHGGAETVNVFTRILLALYGVLSWSAVPVSPVEIVFLPRWSPVDLLSISYWGRTVMVPLLVLQALKPRAKHPRGTDIDELFVADPRAVRTPARAPHQARHWYRAFAIGDAILRVGEGVIPGALRQRAIARAIAFVEERANGEHGLGAIFPAMANTVMMFDALGYARDDPRYVAARKAVDRLLVIRDDEAYCQPCVSPIWDTALAGHALMEAGDAGALAAARRGMDWLVSRQVLDAPGDWTAKRPHVRPGGWPFQYENPHYPDLDDTAAVVIAMDRCARAADGQADAVRPYGTSIDRGVEWVVGLQSSNGGWGAFDVDNTREYLNNIPFADHGALLDPPTSDVTARCVGMLAQLGRREDRPALERGLAFLRAEQCADGSWYGRWGMNYLYGTWSVLCAFDAVAQFRTPADDDAVRRAARWLASIQNADGGWGESADSYALESPSHCPASSTASQTAWALLALMAAGETASIAVERGIAWLVRTQQADGFWDEPEFTATGFPRVFYLRYHGYPKFFPLWALGRYRRLTQGQSRATFGM